MLLILEKGGQELSKFIRGIGLYLIIAIIAVSIVKPSIFSGEFG